jgi:hypothetical protein
MQESAVCGTQWFGKVPRMERKGAHKCSAGRCNVVRRGCKKVPCVVHNDVGMCRAWSARVQVNAVGGCSTWRMGCRKVPCVIHNGEKVLGAVLVDGRLLLEVGYCSFRCRSSRAWAWCQTRACLASGVSLLVVTGMGRMAVEVDEKRDKGTRTSVGFDPSCFNDVA